ncbi:MAG: phosphoribulokinase [Acidimicrobiales bacterium]
MTPKTVTMRRVSSNGGRRPTMLAIAGDSAAGKTTLTRGLVAALAGALTSICVDDYHRYDREQRRHGVSCTPLDPAGNYVGIMEQHLQLLAMGEPILKPVYNHSGGTLDRPVLYEPTDKVVVEGLLPLYSPLARACFDLSVYVDPPEVIRRKWKVERDTRDRGYTTEQVLADLDKREPDSAAFIRPQRQWADIVVRFAPIEERGETDEDPLSATILLRPTAPHPDLSALVGEADRGSMHLKLIRDDDGKPVDALHVHGYASWESTREIGQAIWLALGVDFELPASIGMIGLGQRSGPLAIVQLILLHHLLARRERQPADLDVVSAGPRS